MGALTPLVPIAAAALAALQQHVHVLKTDRLHSCMGPLAERQGSQPYHSHPSKPSTFIP